MGVVGVIIGLISFFFYAVANDWLGPTAQVAIGILVGIVMFIIAFVLREKRMQWSLVLFGGSYFVEYISISVGVNYYEVIPIELGLVLSLVFLISSLLLAVTFCSVTIAYFSIVGGYLVPFISGLYSSDVFIMVLYVLLSCALVIVSFYKHWSSVRFTSFLIMALALLLYSGKLFRT